MAAESNLRAEGRGGSVVQSRAIEKREQLLLDAAAVFDEQHRASSRLTEAAAATGAGPIEQLVMMCHGLARQIIDDTLVRGGIRLTM
ncbi:hypothetical protein [Microbacterium sp. 2MCAF23]|uniref:hypothetical protein n=1 Tax=Microbacterium sp. 2MCAF23 TaxID=3232985 RepID=UPI003F9B8677